VSWSFEFEDQEWFAGFRDLATNGVDKPVLNVFRMLGMMSGHRISVQSENGLSAEDIIANGVRGKNDIHAVASKDKNSISIMVWNYHDDNVPGALSTIELFVDNIGSKKVLVHHYRVDDQFSNSFEKWKAMGKPQDVTAEQYKELEQAGQLQLYTSPEWKNLDSGKAVLNFDLPRQGVSFIQLTW
jgi:xylan 1,4-beta-xylosidase